VIDKDEPRGRADLEEAMVHAARAHDGEREAEAAYHLFHGAVSDENATRADSLQPVARAAIARAGHTPWEIDEAAAEANLLMSRGKIDDSLAVCDRIAALDPGDRKGLVAHCRCTADLSGQRYDAAGAPCRLDVEQAERRYGRGHVRTAASLHNLALLTGHLGDYAKEAEIVERALAIRRAANGDSPGVVVELVDLAGTLRFLHRFDEALARAREALAMLDRIGGPPTQDHALAHAEAGGILLHLDRTKEALAELEQALHITETVAGRDSVSVTSELSQLSRAYLAAGRPEDALAALRRAAPIIEKELGPASQAAAVCAANEAATLTELHRAGEAIPLAEKAISIGAAAHLRPIDLAQLQVTLGHALLDGGQRARSREVLGRARDTYRQAGRDWADDLAYTEQLLAR
jgi:tetratricopeptide (TPR) repeat protein